MDTAGCVPTSHNSSRKALKNDTTEETSEVWRDSLTDENDRVEGKQGGGKGKAKDDPQSHLDFTPLRRFSCHTREKTKMSSFIAGCQNSGASLIQQHHPEMR